MIGFLKKSFTLLCLFLVLPGCFLAPTMDSISRAGLTPGDREALLPERIKKYGDSLYWGNPNQALAFVDPGAKEKILDELRSRSPDEKIVETKVLIMDFNEDAFVANVDVLIRSYKVPFYIVNERKERQVWNFSFTKGWRLASSDLIISK